MMHAALQHNERLERGMVIRELYPEENDKVQAFLLALNDHDRYRRFGRPMTDEILRQYVSQIDWDDSVLLGAFDPHAELIGLLELADVAGACEIAIAVASPHRGRGIGRALMDRALLKAKVRGSARVLLLCQMDNEPMRRLARSAGLHATVDDGEITGTLDLPQAGLAEVTEDATREAIGNATYAMLLGTRAWADLFESAAQTSRHLLPES
jgi:GNAT superfamily N-acetyltransferase